MHFHQVIDCRRYISCRQVYPLNVTQIHVSQMMQSEATLIEYVRESFSLINLIFKKSLEAHRECPVYVDRFMARSVQCTWGLVTKWFNSYTCFVDLHRELLWWKNVVKRKCIPRPLTTYALVIRLIVVKLYTIVAHMAEQWKKWVAGVFCERSKWPIRYHSGMLCWCPRVSNTHSFLYIYFIDADYLSLMIPWL